MKNDLKVCPAKGRCGGCRYQGISYRDQLSIKMMNLIGLLGRYGHVDEIEGMDDPLYYRCKVNSAIGIRNGRIISGQYAPSTHRIITVPECMLEDRSAAEVINTVKSLMKKHHLRAFEDDKMTGFLRHVQIRVGRYSGQLLVTLVTAREEFPNAEAFVSDLTKAHPAIRSVVQSVNSDFTSVVLGRTSRVLFGDGYIEDSLCGMNFRISSGSFYQVNPVMASRLYEDAIGFLKLKKTDRLIDAYCGTGTRGIIASKNAGSVIGVEQNAAAVKDAAVNASANGRENITFVKADASEYMSRLAKQGEHIDCVIMDPPRSGSTVKFMKSMKELSPSRVAYISCDPSSLSRDLGWLTRNGYRVKRIRPYDMFPFTEHVETVVCLSNKNAKPKDYVEIGVDAEDYYRIKDSGKK